MTALTNTAIERLLPGEHLYDHIVPGLHIRCNVGGRSWMFWYRFNGRPRRPKIGDYPVIGIAQAREIARGLVGQVASGKDPSRLRAEARGEQTVAGLWERVAREHYGAGRGWDKEAARLYKTIIGPSLGKLRLSEVVYDDLARMHAKHKTIPIGANRALAVLGKMLDLAEKWGLRTPGSNPCRHVSRYKETSRRRFATAEEIARLGRALDRAAETDPAGAVFLFLLLYTGARPSEIERATWGQLDGSVLRIPEGKTGHRDVFLPPQATAIIARLPNYGPERRIVGCQMPKKLWAKIRKEIGAPDLWARDLRRTFATVALSNGVSIGVVGELLGHRSSQTTKVYAKLMEQEAKRTTAKIADHMTALMAPKEKSDALGVDTYAVDL